MLTVRGPVCVTCLLHVQDWEGLTVCLGFDAISMLLPILVYGSTNGSPRHYDLWHAAPVKRGATRFLLKNV